VPARTFGANIGLFCAACLLSDQHIRCSGLDMATIISDNPWGTDNMARSDARKEGAVSSEFLRTSRIADPRAVTVTSEQTLLSGQAAQFVFRAPGGSVVTLGGIVGAALRELVAPRFGKGF
jgi:hypothetical protein